MKMKNKDILITGASGNAGAEIIKKLHSKGICPVAAGSSMDKLKKNPGNKALHRKLDFYDSGTFDAALEGINTVFLMRPPAISKVKKHIFPFIDSCADKKTGHIVFLSLQGAEKNNIAPHSKIEKYIKKKKIPYTFLRPGFFMQNLSGIHRDEIKNKGEIYLPAGRGATSFIDVRDVAEAAVKCMLEKSHKNKAYELTGEKSLTYYEAAGIMSEILGRKIKYISASPFSFFFKKISEKKPAGYAFVMTSLYTICRLGLAGNVTDEFRKLTGKNPVTFRKFVIDNKEKWQSLQETDTCQPV